MAYDYIQWTTILIAIYGAALSSILGIAKLLENRRRIKVKLSRSIVTLSLGRTESVLSLSCSNIGKRPITLNSYGIEFPDKRNLIFVNQAPDRLPKTLADGEGCTLWTNLKQVSKDMYEEGFSHTVKLRGFFGDATGGKYFSKKFKFNPTTRIKD